MAYESVWDFYQDTDRLAHSGASLRELYDLVAGDGWFGAATNSSAQRLKELASHWTQEPVFIPIRLAELFAGASPEHGDDYVLAMVAGLGGRRDQQLRLHFLRLDHELRETTFWRIFEVEGGGEVSLANVDKFSREELSWHRTVLLLANEGTLDRRRVLRSCLVALNRDFSAYRAGWFSRLYTALDPTPAEAAADQDQLRLSLGAKVTATLSLAARQLARIAKAGLLQESEFVAAAGAGLAGSKAAASELIRVLAQLGVADPTDAAVAQALAVGLGHAHPDVQRAAAKALLKSGWAALVSDALPHLSPGLAAELADHLGSRPGPARPNTTAQPVVGLPEVTQLVPWTDGDAVDRFAALLEQPVALELELGLAWLAEAANPGEVLRALGRRASKVKGESGDRFLIASLIRVAIEPQQEFLPQTYWQRHDTFRDETGEWVSVPVGEPQPRPTAEESTVLPSFITRLRELAAILQGAAPKRPLLATPTHSDGSIELSVARDRLAAIRATAPKHWNPRTAPGDLNQAILRLRVEDRPPFLAAASATAPEITRNIGVEWVSWHSSELRSDGTPRWTWWRPLILAGPAQEPSATNPGLVPSSPAERLFLGSRECSDLIAAELGLVDPTATLPLVAVGLGVINSAVQEGAEHRAGPILDALGAHRGAWTAATADLVALAMSAQQLMHRAQGVELLAAAVPARLSAETAAAGFARTAMACVLSRWTGSFTDLAAIAPGTTFDIMVALLPQLDPKARGVSGLLQLLLDESLRADRRLESADLIDYLSAFRGSSAAARAARTLLTRTGG